MAVMAVMVMMADINDNLGVRRFSERCSENKGKQAVQKDFHTYSDSHSRAQVVIPDKIFIKPYFDTTHQTISLGTSP